MWHSTGLGEPKLGQVMKKTELFGYDVRCQTKETKLWDKRKLWSLGWKNKPRGNHNFVL